MRIIANDVEVICDLLKDVLVVGGGKADWEGVRNAEGESGVERRLKRFIYFFLYFKLEVTA